MIVVFGPSMVSPFPGRNHMSHSHGFDFVTPNLHESVSALHHDDETHSSSATHHFSLFLPLKVQVQEEGFHQGLEEVDRGVWQARDRSRPAAHQEVLHGGARDRAHPDPQHAQAPEEGSHYGDPAERWHRAREGGLGSLALREVGHR